MAERPRSPQDVAVFLMSAWRALVGLEEAMEGLSGPESVTALQSFGGLAGELSRSAGEHGFEPLSRLAADMERLTRVFPPIDHASAADVLQLLTDTLNVLPAVLDNLAAEARDDIPQVAELQWRFDVEIPAAAELAAQRRRHETPGPVDEALARLGTADPEMMAFFIPEVRDHLRGMTRRLRELEQETAGGDALNDFFRHVHTVKGAAYTVDCPEIGDLAHDLEEIWVAIRQGTRDLTPEILRAGNRSTALIERMVDRLEGIPGPALQSAYGEARTRLEALRQAANRDAPGAVPPVSVPGASLAADAPPEPTRISGTRATLRVDLERLESVLDTAGEMAVAHGTYVDRLQQLEGLHRQLDDCRRRMTRTVGVFQDRHLNPVLEDDRESETVWRGAGPGGDIAERFAELEFDRYDDFNILARRMGELSSDLAEIHGELERMLAAARHGSARVQGLTRRLRIGVGKVRRVPVGRLFARFSRLARKASEEAGKPLEIELSGEQVELDNAILERLAEALTHLVQNAVHHGIETPEVRRRRGKDPVAKLRLIARARGRRVHLEIADDGAGIDREALKDRAIRAGLLSAAEVAALDDEETLELIYLPGLTTSAEVTTAVGRGVGMDAARHSVLRLGGEVRVHTESGAGTRFVLELPVSLLVTEALVVKVGGSSFALPLPQVDRIQHLFEPQISLADDRELAVLEDRAWPLVRLADRLGLAAHGPTDDMPGLLATAVLVRAPSFHALAVDGVVGIEELVVKPLDAFLEGASFLSGTALDTRGRIILMLDLPALVTGETRPRPAPPVTELPEAPPRVLLADDSLSVRRVLGRALQQAGYEVLTARDGAEALELILDQPFDAVISDLEMPRMSGYELIDDLRTRASTREIPVWVVTTRAGARHADLARELGAVGYLAKPVDAELLVGQLESVLRPGEAG